MVPHPHIDVLGEVLRVLRVPEVRECQAVYRCPGTVVQLRQRLSLPGGDSRRGSCDPRRGSEVFRKPVGISPGFYHARRSLATAPLCALPLGKGNVARKARC